MVGVIGWRSEPPETCDGVLATRREQERFPVLAWRPVPQMGLCLCWLGQGLATDRKWRARTQSVWPLSLWAGTKGAAPTSALLVHSRISPSPAVASSRLSSLQQTPHSFSPSPSHSPHLRWRRSRARQRPSIGVSPRSSPVPASQSRSGPQRLPDTAKSPLPHTAEIPSDPTDTASCSTSSPHLTSILLSTVNFQQ